MRRIPLFKKEPSERQLFKLLPVNALTDLKMATCFDESVYTIGRSRFLFSSRVRGIYSQINLHQRRR